MNTAVRYLEWTSESPSSLNETYKLMQTKAFFNKIASFLTGQSRNLFDLASEVSGRKILGQHYAGARTVPIHQIRGSEGRCGDFDIEFNPLNSRTAGRWMSVAVAFSQGVTLPPVELIQVDEVYFVRDGHHRISVARAFGEKYIDAVVTVLQLDPVSTLSPSLAMPNISSK